MSFLISTRAELLKTRRSSSFWVCVFGSAFIPIGMLLFYTLDSKKIYPKLQLHPWEQHLTGGWQGLSHFLLPMFVILICSLVVQIEYKNNAWKQVFASPQTLGNIFFSKFLTIHLMILFLFLLFNFFMILSALLSNLIIPEYTFLKNPINWDSLLKLNVKTYMALLGMSAIQYWLSLRFKNFIASVGIGLALLIASLILFNFWDQIDKLPYAYTLLTAIHFKPEGWVFQNHELYSVFYLLGFILLAFLDMKYRKERG